MNFDADADLLSMLDIVNIPSDTTHILFEGRLYKTETLKTTKEEPQDDVLSVGATNGSGNGMNLTPHGSAASTPGPYQPDQLNMMFGAVSGDPGSVHGTPVPSLVYPGTQTPVPATPAPSPVSGYTGKSFFFLSLRSLFNGCIFPGTTFGGPPQGTMRPQDMFREPPRAPRAMHFNTGSSYGSWFLWDSFFHSVLM
jgi:hypothetical protein